MNKLGIAVALVLCVGLLAQAEVVKYRMGGNGATGEGFTDVLVSDGYFSENADQYQPGSLYTERNGRTPRPGRWGGQIQYR